MSANLVYIFWAFLAGSLISIQPLINVKLSHVVNSPLWAAFISFLVGTIALFVIAFSFTGKLPIFQAGQFQWWMLLGGLLGAFLLTVSIFAAPKLGVTAMIALFIAGQLMMALALDHFGILADVAHPITLKKILGVALLFAGALLTLNIQK